MASSMDEPRPSYLADSDPEHDRHRRRVALVVFLVVLSLLVVGVAFANSSYNRCKQPPVADGRTVTFEVPQGATGRDVVAALADQGLIRCGGFVGDLLLRGAGNANGILAGTYRIPVGSSLDQIITIVSTPPKHVSTVSLTVPEGCVSGRRTRVSEASRASSRRRPASARTRSRKPPRIRRSPCRRTCRPAPEPKGSCSPTRTSS
jgi:cell division protein YceG involved in septum cleavage